MISFQVKTNKGNKTIQAKTSWDELTFNELLEIEKLGDSINNLDLFSILTNESFDELANSTDEAILEVLANATLFVYSNPDWQNLECPKVMEIGERVYNVPNLKKLSLGQKILLTQLASKDSMMEILPEAVAIVMCNEVYGEFTRDTEKNIPKLVNRIKESNAIQAYSVGQYFFLNCQILTQVGQSNLKKSQRSQTKTQQ